MFEGLIDLPRCVGAILNMTTGNLREEKEFLKIPTNITTTHSLNCLPIDSIGTCHQMRGHCCAYDLAGYENVQRIARSADARSMCGVCFSHYQRHSSS